MTYVNVTVPSSTTVNSTDYNEKSKELPLTAYDGMPESSIATEDLDKLQKSMNLHKVSLELLGR